MLLIPLEHNFSQKYEEYKIEFLLSIKPPLEAAIGPLKGNPEIDKAAEQAIIDNISASF